jgi:hypothetical protein
LSNRNRGRVVRWQRLAVQVLARVGRERNRWRSRRGSGGREGEFGCASRGRSLVGERPGQFSSGEKGKGGFHKNYHSTYFYRQRE